MAQLLAEGKGRLLVLAPATLRAQWQAELVDKFDLPSVVVDGRTVRATGNVFDQPLPVIASHPFGAGRARALAEVPWDLVVIDEAHRLRNAHRSGNKTGRALREALRDRPKLLLTATPLQNELMELFGLLSLLDEQILGPEHAFRARYTRRPGGRGGPRRAGGGAARPPGPGGPPHAAAPGEGVRPLHRAAEHGGGLRPLRRGTGALRAGLGVPAPQRGRGHRAGEADAAHAGLPEAPRLLDLRHRPHPAQAGGEPAGTHRRRPRRCRGGPPLRARGDGGLRRGVRGLERRAGDAARGRSPRWRPRPASSSSTRPAPRRSGSTPRARP